MRLFLILFMFSMLMGCTTAWERPGMTQAQLRQDEDECTRWARDAAPPAWRDSLFNRCMYAKGYQ